MIRVYLTLLCHTELATGDSKKTISTARLSRVGVITFDLQEITRQTLHVLPTGKERDSGFRSNHSRPEEFG
jgi:hypothetical protein